MPGILKPPPFMKNSALDEWLFDLYNHLTYPRRPGTECFVMPEYYGALGDGTTDDTDALQAGLNALTSGGILWLGPKTYVISSALQLPDVNNITIQGCGWSTVIYQTDTSGENGIEITGTVADAGWTTGLVIKDLLLLGNASAGDALYLQRIAQSKIESVKTDTWGGDGFQINSSLSSIFTQCYATGCINGFHVTTYYTVTAQSSSNNNLFNLPITRVTDGAGFKIESDATNDLEPKKNKVILGDFESDGAVGTIGVHIKGGLQNDIDAWIEGQETGFKQETNTDVETHIPIGNLCYNTRATVLDYGLDIDGGSDTIFAFGWLPGLDDVNIASGVTGTKLLFMRGIPTTAGEGLTDAGTRTIMLLADEGTLTESDQGFYFKGSKSNFDNTIEFRQTYIRKSQTLADDATPSVANGNMWKTGGTTTITDFDDGVTDQVITILGEHSTTTITHGTNIFLNGGTNFVMVPGDTLTLICRSDNKWYEMGRGDIS